MTIPQAFALALELHEAGRLAEAEKMYRQVLALDPDHCGALDHLGAIAFQVGRPTVAIPLLSRALALNPRDAIVAGHLGAAYFAAGQRDDALLQYRRAAELEPLDPDTHNNLGIVLRVKGEWNAAESAYRRALELQPDHPLVLNNLGNVLQEQGRLEEAAAAFEHALRLKPDYAEAHCNLGFTLAAQDRLEAAMAAQHRALALKPDYAAAHNHLGSCWRDLGRWIEAEASYRLAIACPGGSEDARFNLGLLLLLLGRYDEGWSGYERRWWASTRGEYRREFSVPPWDGQPKPGKTILIHSEQGFGDTLQFIRYLPLARERAGGARFIFECHPALLSLLRQCGGPDTEIMARSRGDALLPRFDLHLPLLSLPLVLRSFAPLSIDAPYLQAADDLRAQWRERLGNSRALRVGLAWAGNPSHRDDRHRSVPPEKLLRILNVPGVSFTSLQVASGRKFPDCLASAGVTDFTAELADFAATAALMAELDLVLTVDTATSHLAGALGRPVWVLLPFVPDWRWGPAGEKTPWYPTMRLFRQSGRGVWDDVLCQVAESLHRLVEEDPPA